MNDQDAGRESMSGMGGMDAQALLRAWDEIHLRHLVRVALEDLVQVRQAYGTDTAAWRERVRQVLAWFSDSLEPVLAAALVELERRGRDGQR